MKVVFYGVTAWGNAALSQLLDAGIEIWSVFSRTEKGPCPHFPIEDFCNFARGRGCKVIVDRTADDDPALLDEMQSAGIDLLVSAGYYRKIGAASIAAAARAVNIHPSLLPRYRGSAPSNWVIINGERETGVTLHLLTDRFDAGDICIQHRMPISATETVGQLRSRQSAMMGDVLMEYVNVLRSGIAPGAIRQDERRATSYRAIKRRDARIDATLPVESILNLIRGTTPWPGPWIEIGGTFHDIASASSADVYGAPVGTVIENARSSITIAAFDGAVRYEFA